MSNHPSHIVIIELVSKTKGCGPTIRTLSYCPIATTQDRAFRRKTPVCAGFGEGPTRVPRQPGFGLLGWTTLVP